MARAVKERLPTGELDDPALVHDPDRLRHVPHDGEIVGDEQIREAELLLQVPEEVQDLRLDRDVDRGHGLVEHDEFGRIEIALAILTR